MAEAHDASAKSTWPNTVGKRTRVGYFIDTQAWGGAEAVVLSCCEALRRSEFEPILLHFDNPELARECEGIGVEVLVVPGHKQYKRGARLPQFAAGFARFLRAHDIALLHSHLYGPIVAGALGARLAGIPQVGTLHDIYVIEESAWRLPLLCLARLLGTRLVTVSADMHAHYTTKACLRRAGITTIYNGIADRPVAPQQRSEFRQRWEAGEHDIVFICVARFVALKRHDLLVKAFAELRDLPAVRLVLFGEGPTQQQIADLIAAEGLAERVLLAGHSHAIQAALNAADVFVLASDTEGLSRSILEAMASGLPIIATDVGGNRELVTDNGLLTAPGNRKELAKAMRSLATDAARRVQLASNSRANASSRFSSAMMLTGYLKIYRQMLHA